MNSICICIRSSALFENFTNNSFNHYSTFFILSISFGQPAMNMTHEKVQNLIKLTSFETFWKWPWPEKDTEGLWSLPGPQP